MKSLPFHIPDGWKRYLFHTEPPFIGNQREYTAPSLLPSLQTINPPRRFWDNKFHCSSKKLTRSWMLCSPVVCTGPLIHPPINSGDNSHESLSIISRGDRRGSKLPTSYTLHYWLLPLFSCLPSPVGYSGEFLVGMCRPVLKILTLFLTKKFHYPHPFSDLASKSQTRFQT